jgi:hypothetical protein
MLLITHKPPLFGIKKRNLFFYVTVTGEVRSSARFMSFMSFLNKGAHCLFRLDLLTAVTLTPRVVLFLSIFQQRLGDLEPGSEWQQV